MTSMEDYERMNEELDRGAVAQQAVSHVSSQDKNRVTAGVLAILLGTWGAHKFYLGYKREGGIMLAVTLASLVLLIFTFGVSMIGVAAMGIIALAEGVLYLTKTDEQFEAMYVLGHKGWF